MPASDHGHDVAVIVAVAQLGDLPVVQVEGDEVSSDAEEHPVGREGSPLVVFRGELGGEGEVGHVHDGGARVEEQVREGVEHSSNGGRENANDSDYYSSDLLPEGRKGWRKRRVGARRRMNSLPNA